MRLHIYIYDFLPVVMVSYLCTASVLAQDYCAIQFELVSEIRAEAAKVVAMALITHID